MADLASFSRSLAHGLDPSLIAEDLKIDLDPWQRDALRSENDRIILNCSRQSGKSTVAALRATQELIYGDPGSLIVIVAPSQRQSTELFRIIAGYIATLHPSDVSDETTMRMQMRNGSRLLALPGTMNTIRGLSSASLVILDEAAFIDDELISTIRPMLAIRRGRMVALSTPAGTQGFFYETWKSGLGWDRYQVTCWDVPRFDRAWLEQERDLLGPLKFAREYECQFTQDDDALFTAELIEAALDDSIEPLLVAA